jgi:hypothetical protein
MADRIIDGTQFNANNIIYCAPKATPQGAKSVNILSKNTKTFLTLSTPLMLTWGASDFVDEKTGISDGKFSLALQFPSDEYKNEDTSVFLLNMKALEDKIKSDALVNSKEWFGKVHKSAEVVEALWTPMLKYPKNKQTGEYDYNKQPTLKIKLPQWEGSWRSEIYDEEGEKLYPCVENPGVSPLDYLKKGTNIACLIQFAGIWFVNGKFSASWKLVQAVVQKPKASLQGQCLIPLKPKDKEVLKNQKVVDDDTEDHITSTIVDDSDNEEDMVISKTVPTPLVSVPAAVVSPIPIQTVEEVEAVPPPKQLEEEPAKVIKKKIVKKKET